MRTKEEVADVENCALSIRKTLKILQQEMKHNKQNQDYVDYLQEAYTKMTTAMLYAQEIKNKLKIRQQHNNSL